MADGGHVILVGKPLIVVGWRAQIKKDAILKCLLFHFFKSGLHVQSPKFNLHIGGRYIKATTGVRW